jgi:hypothetical protein
MANKFGGDPNCVAWWQFEPGLLLEDTKGTNPIAHNVYGKVTVDQLHRREGRGAAYFPSDSYLMTEDGAFATGFPLQTGDETKTISVCFWIRFEAKPAGADGFWGAFHWGLIAAPHQTLGEIDPHWAIGWHLDESNTEVYESEDLIPETGTWYHVGATYNDADRSYRLRVWDDGEGEVAEISGNGEASVAVGSTSLYLGYYTTFHDYLQGQMDEVVVFNDILTAEEIDQIRTGTYVKEYPWGGTCAIRASLSAELTAPAYCPWAGIATWSIKEKVRFNTEILQSHDRTEQRIAKRQGIPRQVLAMTHFSRSEAETAALDAVLHSWAKKPWPVPLWYDSTAITADLASGSSSLSFDARWADYRQDGFAILWTREHHEIVTVASLTDTGLTFLQPTQSAFIAPFWVMPVRQGYLLASADKKRQPGGRALIDMTFGVTDNAAITRTEPEQAAIVTYDGFEVVNLPSKMRGKEFEESHDPDTVVLDAATGIFEVRSNSPYNEVTQDHVWFLQTRGDCWKLRQLLHAIRGRQVEVLVPTWQYDLTLTQDVDGTNVYVAYTGVSDFMGANPLRTYVASWNSTTKALTIRKVTAIEKLSATEEKLTVNVWSPFWKAGDHLCWVDKCRLADDDVDIEWRGQGKLTCAAKWVRVP